jgi:hypothetical protein
MFLNPFRMKTISALLIIAVLLTINTQAQEVLKLNEHTPVGKGNLSQLQWLQGYWAGTGLGGNCAEQWQPAIDNSMIGTFHFSEKGTLNFSEYMIMTAHDSTLTLKLKHFSRDLSPWEEKDKWTEFKLIKIEGQTAYFNGLTYHRADTTLTIKLMLSNKEKSWVETFSLQKTDL